MTNSEYSAEPASNSPLEMEIFRAGDYGKKGRYTEVDLTRLAEDYNPEILEAPLTFDHARTGPAFGWVAGLKRKGDRLVAVIKDVPSAVRDILRKGLFKRRSVEIVRSFSETGRPYLRAVTLLGAATPEVKGLREVAFSEPDNAEEISEIPERYSGRKRAEALELAVLFSALRSEGFCLTDQTADDIRLIFRNEDEEWESFGEELSPRYQAMARLLRQMLPKVPTGLETRFTSASSGVMRFAEGCEPRSMKLHEKALELQAQNGELSFRDAVVQASSLL